MPHRPRALAALAIVGVAAIAAAGCGSSSSGGGAATTADTTTVTTGTDTTTAPATSTTAPSTATTGAAATTLQLAAAGNELKFDKTTLTAAAGDVTIMFTNPSGIPHDVAIEDSSGKDLGTSPIIQDGKTTELKVTLQPGTYTFYCSVDGHEDAGMKGTLTVT